MVANWSHLFPQRFGTRPGGGDESHKKQCRGNPDVYGSQEFFSSQGRRSKEGAKGFHERENDLLFRVLPVHIAALARYIGEGKFPCNLKYMEPSNGTSDWRRRPRFRSRDHRG